MKEKLFFDEKLRKMFFLFFEGIKEEDENVIK
jgi:hypothetical protein